MTFEQGGIFIVSHRSARSLGFCGPIRITGAVIRMDRLIASYDKPGLLRALCIPCDLARLPPEDVLSVNYHLLVLHDNYKDITKA